MPDNTVTFYRPEKSINSFHPVVAVVEVDGRPAPWLELTELVRQKGPELNRAYLKLVNSGSSGTARFENIAQAAQPGQNILVNIVYTTDTATCNQMTWPLFNGVIVQGSGTLAGDGEEVEIVAVNQVVYNNGAAIDGYRALGITGQNVYVKNDKVVFNPDGRANSSKSTKEIDGQTYHIFDSNQTTADYWNLASAVRYVVSEYLSGTDVSLDSLNALERQTSDHILRDVDISGLTPLAAIDRLCRRAGLYFCVSHVPTLPNQTRDVLHFYRQGVGREIFLRHQPPGVKFNLSNTNLSGCSIKTVCPSETIRAIGRGELKRFESTFELIKAWDPALEINNYELYSPTTNNDFLQYKDVFRKWTLNEAGDYSGSPYNQGNAYDLSGVFGTQNYSLSRRRFRPCLSRNTDGTSFGYYVEVSYDDGQIWRPYGGAFNILLDQCGIYISSNQLDATLWVAICKDVLRFRVTASVDSDKPLEAIISDGPINASRPVRSVVFDLGNEYKYRQVTPENLSAGYRRRQREYARATAR